MVDQAHDLGMYVIFDWVPGHTGWDHVWIESNPEYYLKNEAGEIIDPIDPRTGQSFGWTDVADLDYDNQAMRTAMKEAMLYWVKEVDIDGYRIDQAYAVPMDFYEDTFDAIKKLKEAKEHLDLELISQEEYDDLKNELKHLIISSDKKRAERM